MKKVGFKSKKGFVSGERFCGLTDTRAISQKSLGCSKKNQMLTFLTIAKKKRVATWSDCRDLCNAEDECEYFQWKVILRKL